MTTLADLTQLLTQLPGNLAYHLVVLFAIGGALQAAWAQWQQAPYPQTRRLMQGMMALFAVRLLLFALGGLAWQETVPPHIALPIADRAAAAFTIALFTWMWGFPEKHRRGDLFLQGTVAVIVLGVVASRIFWPQYANRYFNNSPIDLAWSVFSILLGITGILILLQRRPNGANAGLIALGVLTLGHITHALLPLANNDLDSSLRLAELLAYPLVFTLPYRFNAPQQAKTVPAKTTVQVQKAATEPPDAAALEALLDLLGTLPTDSDTCPKIARLGALLLKADLCLVTTPPQRGHIGIACSYDLIREQALAGTTLSTSNTPILTTAMKRRRSLRLPASSTSVDVRTLARALNIERTGPILAVPLDPGGDAPLQGSLVLLSPYAQHAWTSEEQKRLDTLGIQLAKWLHRHTQQPTEYIEALEQENAALQQKAAKAEEAAAKAEEAQERMAALAAAYEDAQRLIEQVEAENQRLQSLHAEMLAELEEARQQAGETAQAAQAEETTPEEETGQATATQSAAPAEAKEEDLATLSEALEQTRQEMEHIMTSLREAREENENHRQNLRVLLSMAQDLRQPLASLLGYTDLLLAESAGILGALQRQFLERTRASGKRLEQAVDDIVRVLAFDTNDVTLSPQQVELSKVIDEAIAQNAGLFREKRQLLRVDLPETLPAVQLDREMLYQIVYHLLRNAAMASPEEGEIHLRLRITDEDEEKFILLEITDSGGGIAVEDIPHVFSRRYRTTYRTIAGLGDNGLGMPLVKTLVEALEGRIWIESKPDQPHTTFTLLLPLVPTSEVS